MDSLVGLALGRGSLYGPGSGLNGPGSGLSAVYQEYLNIASGLMGVEWYEEV